MSTTGDTISIYRRRPRCFSSKLSHEKENVQESNVPENAAQNCNSKTSSRRKAQPRWIDRSLSSRSNINSDDAYSFSSSRKATQKSKQVIMSPNVHRKKRVEAPANFVQEQKNYFSEVDAFELEEESPPSKERWVHELQQKDAMAPGVQFYQRGLLQSVQEDTPEESLNDNSIFHLSTRKDRLGRILETPQSFQNFRKSESRRSPQRPRQELTGDTSVMIRSCQKATKTPVIRELALKDPSNVQSHSVVFPQTTLKGIANEALDRSFGMEKQPVCCKLLMKEPVPYISLSSDDENGNLEQPSKHAIFSNSHGQTRRNDRQKRVSQLVYIHDSPKDTSELLTDSKASVSLTETYNLHDERAKWLVETETIERQFSDRKAQLVSSDLLKVGAIEKGRQQSVPEVINLDASPGNAFELLTDAKTNVLDAKTNLDYERTGLDELIEKLQAQSFDSLVSSELFEHCSRVEEPKSFSPHISEQFPSLEAILKKCSQKVPLPLKEAIMQFSDMKDVLKLGEGTYGEAFRSNNLVFKIVPMDGNFRVNDEEQKTSADMYTEMLLTLTLNRLRQIRIDSALQLNMCDNFIETKMVKVCQGEYDKVLIDAWEEWDTKHGSENDHPKVFPENQLYMLFILTDGGKDLESFSIISYGVARSILIQVTTALAIAEEDCEFEHRDLHWGNILVAQTELTEIYCKLDGKDLHIDTCGVFVRIIDFTLSRLYTGKEVLFSNLSEDPLLFEGPRGDIQAEVYRKMLHLTKGQWDKRFSKTNCFWIHYLVDTLLTKKKFPSLHQEKRALRAFKKRILSYDSARACLEDELFASFRKEGL